MNANREAEAAIAHQASEWVTVLRRKASAAELAAFADWVKTSPRHIREFLLMSALEQELHHADPQRQFGLHEAAGDSVSNVLPLQQGKNVVRESAAHRLERSKRARRWAFGAAAASAVLAIALWPQIFSGQTYSTAIGEQRTLELADGSIVHLNTHSKINTRLSEDARDIELVAGEALFKVHRDPSRPFRVHSRRTTIQAVGTEFNVYQRGQSTRVTVLEGKVRISPREQEIATPLSAGEEARITVQGTVTKHAAPDVAGAVAWRQRRLVFQNEPLAGMVQEFNRYNKAPQFRLEGGIGRQRHYTGVFDADDPESLVELLSAEPGLTVKRNAGEIVIGARDEPAT